MDPERLSALCSGVLLLLGSAGVLFAWIRRRPLPGWRWFRRLLEQRSLLLLLLFIGSFALAAWVSLEIREPIPKIHDEFSYLLAADTYLHGRLTNPTHPMWRSFETFHVLQVPTYMSKYPPAQGAVIALGLLLTGLPIFGIWLSFALSIAAVGWMLMAWVPRRWAFGGAALLALHPVVLGWSQSWWGGCIAMAGGAMILGGARRLIRGPLAPGGAGIVAGLVLLATSRPYEGLVLSAMTLLTCGAVLARRNVRGPAFRALSAAVVVAGLLVGVITGWINLRVTGHPLLMPHALYQQEYIGAPYFITQSSAGFAPARLEEAPAAMERFHREEEYGIWQHQHDPATRFAALARKVEPIARDYLRMTVRLPRQEPFRVWPLLIPLPALLWIRRAGWPAILALIGSIVFFVAAILSVSLLPHYLSPAVPLFALLWIQLLRLIGVTFRGWRVGRLAQRALVLVWIVVFPATLWQMSRPLPPIWRPAVEKQRIVQKLRDLPGQDLVIVRYGADHFAHFEWVYNRADIDHAEIVWARDEGPAQNRRLKQYFADRRLWLLDADRNHPRLIALPKDRR